MPTGFSVTNSNGITIHSFSDSSDESVDAWGTALADLIESTPADLPFRTLMDVSAQNVSFTRHARQMTLLLFSRYRRRKGRFAFLFSSKTAPHFARIFLASLGRLNFEIAYFSNRDKALEWLQTDQR